MGISTIYHDWMAVSLNIKGLDLLIYMIIHSFSQGGEGCYYGSLETLAKWTNYSKQAVCKSLKKLTEEKYINKEEIKKGAIKYCSYSINKDLIDTVKESLTDHERKFNGTVKESLPNNKSNNKEYNNICNSTKKISTKKSKVEKEFIPPTLEQVKDYCVNVRKNNVDYKRFYDYYEVNGWKDGINKPLVNWKQKIVAWWEPKAKEYSKPNTTQPLEDNRKAFKDMTEEEKIEYWRKVDAEIAERNSRRG